MLHFSTLEFMCMCIIFLYLKKIRKSAYNPLKQLFFRYQHSAKNGVLYRSNAHVCPESGKSMCCGTKLLPGHSLHPRR